MVIEIRRVVASWDREGGMRELLKVMEKFYILIWVVFTLLYTIVKTHQIVHLRSVWFIDCKLYLKKKIYARVLGRVNFKNTTTSL